METSGGSRIFLRGLLHPPLGVINFYKSKREVSSIRKDFLKYLGTIPPSLPPLPPQILIVLNFYCLIYFLKPCSHVTSKCSSKGLFTPNYFMKKCYIDWQKWVCNPFSPSVPVKDQRCRPSMLWWQLRSHLVWIDLKCTSKFPPCILSGVKATLTSRMGSVDIYVKLWRWRYV